MVAPQHSQSMTIRSLISKRYLTDKDIQNLIDLISKSHISVFKTLSQFFINLRNQLVHSNEIFLNKQVKNNIQQFESPYLRCEIKSLAQLAQIIRKKIQSKNHLFSSQKQSENKESFINISESERILSKLYPQAYSLQKTIHSELLFMKKYYQTKPDNLQIKETDFLKDKLALKIQSKLQEFNNIVNSSFNKQSFYNLEENKFTQEEFYSIKQHFQKVHYNLYSRQSSRYEIKKKSQIMEQIHNLQSISAKCPGCIPFLYKNHKLPRQRCSLMNIEVLNTLDDKRDLRRFKQLVQTFINSKNGGIILFDCHDLFFSINPKGFQCSLKVFQQKKQSLVDICKNIFPDLKINRQFYIDFVLLKDPDILLGRKNQRQQTQNTQIIGRFRILKEKTKSMFQQKQDSGKKQVNFHSVCMNHYIKKLNNDEFGKIQIQSAIFSDSSKFQEILAKIPKSSKYQILTYLQGRQRPVVIHEGRHCKQKPMQIYVDRKRKKQLTEGNNEIIESLTSKSQKFQIGKQPLNLIDKNYRHWSLLVVNVLELQKIDSQMKTFFTAKGINYDLEVPFQDYLFSQSKKTLLIKTSCSHQQFVKIIHSAEAQQNKYFRIYKKDFGYVPLVHVKVYDYIFVSFSKKLTQKQLIFMVKELQSQVKRYFQRKIRQQGNQQKNIRLFQWIEQLKIKIYSHQTRPSIYITTNDWNPSYAILFMYYKLKHESSTLKETRLKRIQLKQNKDFSNQNGYRLIDIN